MKIRPVSRYKSPTYPTMATAQGFPELLRRIPGRWQNSPGFATVLGLVAGFTARVVLAGEPPAKGEAKATVTQPSETPKPAPHGRDASREVGRATAMVAPLLDEALKYDGRGSFGCVAMNPPTFLAEDEALELIRTELEAAGLKLTGDVELGNVMAPAGTNVDGTQQEGAEDGEESAGDSKATHHSFRGRTAKLAPREFMFDLADTNRQVFIEYLSSRDHAEWEERDGTRWSSVSSYNFPELAQRVAGAFQKRKADKPTVFGVFFDPLARAEVPSPEVAGLPAGQQRLAYEEYRKALVKERGKLDDKAKVKLRKQVQHFVAFLRQEGVVASPDLEFRKSGK